MRAVRIHRHGEPVFEKSVPEPMLASGELLVELAYAGLNPVDLFIMQGQVAGDAPLPRVLGIDGSGYLDGVPVLVHGAGIGVVRDGTLAERVGAPPVGVVEIPHGVSLEAATGCGNAGATAVRLVELAKSSPGDDALVLAASGSVGLAVCSLLVGSGVQVRGQIRREGAAELVRSSGAFPVLAQEPEHLAGALGNHKPNMLFDPLGGRWTAAAIELLSLDARHIVYGTITGQTLEIDLRKFYRRSGSMQSYRGILEPPERLRKAVQLALAAVAEGRMLMPIGARLPLSSAASAYALARQSHAGRILIEI